jgi:hypothetical protein
MTPGTFSKSDSVHQKQPPAKVAMAVPGAALVGALSGCAWTTRARVAAVARARPINRVFTVRLQCAVRMVPQ